MTTLVTVGYEGRTADDLAALLGAEHVTVLVDVRLTPQSRKPGLSKRRLAERLQDAGIAYRHVPSLGNPKANRAALRADDPAAIDRFRALLRAPDGAAGLDEVAELTGARRSRCCAWNGSRTTATGAWSPSGWASFGRV